jgi:hypothetical protein
LSSSDTFIADNLITDNLIADNLITDNLITDNLIADNVIANTSIAKRFARGFAIGPFHRTSEDPARSDLEELLYTLRNHSPERRFPKYWRDDLSRQKLRE